MKEYQIGQPLTEYKVLLLGDLSGIQEFIFNVRSDGAAKTLKARSFYVHAVSEISLKLIEAEFGSDNCLLFYNGGGNFYVLCKSLDKKQLKTLRETLQEALVDEEVYITFSAAPFDHQHFDEAWRKIHTTANRDKLLKFREYWKSFDEPNRYDAKDQWRKFIKPFVNQRETQGFEIFEKEGTAPRVSRDGFWLKHTELWLRRSAKLKQFEKSITNKLPVWDKPLMQTHTDLVERANERNAKKKDLDEDERKVKPDDIIEFETLGEMAQKRTGTDKIAVLKMDADHLGDLFLAQKKTEEAKALSNLLKDFFENQMLTLWSQKSLDFTDPNGQSAHDPFFHNIYPVFSGGDDCFFIGGWDAVFDFAGRVQQYFKEKISSRHNTLTLSASLIVLDSKYPVVRLAELAEDALKRAKNAGRNRISIFNEFLTWDDFAKAQKTAHELERLIKMEKEPRGILDRIKRSHIGFSKLQERALGGRVHNPAVWRLFYFLRNSKQNLAVLQPIMETYERALLNAVTGKMQTNPAVFPVAARWAELLTR